MKNQKSKSKIRNSLWKIFKITFFLTIREMYLFFRNLYGLVCHPFLTVKRIGKEQDLSQGLLIFGLPGYFWLGAIIILAVLRFLVGIKGRLGWVAQWSLALITFASGLLFIYLLYWLYLDLKRGKKNEC